MNKFTGEGGFQPPDAGQWRAPRKSMEGQPLSEEFKDAQARDVQFDIFLENFAGPPRMEQARALMTDDEKESYGTLNKRELGLLADRLAKRLKDQLYKNN